MRVASPRRESRRPPLVTRTSRRESLRAQIVAALEAGDCAHALRCPVVLRRPPGWGGTETSGSGWRPVGLEEIVLIYGCSVGVASQLAAFCEESGCSGTSCYLARSRLSLSARIGQLHSSCRRRGHYVLVVAYVMDGFEVTVISATTTLTSLNDVGEKKVSPRRPTTSLFTIRWN